MILREASTDDIPQMQLVRNSVKENMISDPSRITDADYIDYLTWRGKGWVVEVDNRIVGFAIADILDNNIWAMFVDPGHEKQGIGRKLHDVMMKWYFEQNKKSVWLSTSPGTRAETFYRNAGWQESGMHGSNEIRFEMTFERWNAMQE